MADEAGAYWHRVRGLVLPLPVAGHPALEMCNTWSGWSADGRTSGDPAPRDYLKTYEHLLVQTCTTGLLPPVWETRLRRAARSDPLRALAELDSARELRRAAYRAGIRRAGAADLRLLSDLGARARDAQRLIARDGRVDWEFMPAAGLSAPVLAAASAVTDLITGPDAHRVRRCPGHDCGWLFFDTSGRRKWCQMAVCGNRAKARSYARRHRDD